MIIRNIGRKFLLLHAQPPPITHHLPYATNSLRPLNQISYTFCDRKPEHSDPEKHDPEKSTKEKMKYKSLNLTNLQNNLKAKKGFRSLGLYIRSMGQRRRVH